MFKTLVNPISLFLLLLISSCTSDENKDISTYVIKNTNFENILNIDGFVEPVRSTTMVCPGDIEGIVSFLIEDGTYVEEGDVVCTIGAQDLQTTYDQLLLDVENAKAGLNKTKADLEMQYTILEAQVKNNEADTKIAQLDSLQLIYATPSQRKIKELELQKVAIEKTKYEKKLQSLSIIQQSEIKKLELGIQQMENRIQTLKGKLDELTLKAPKKGLAIRSISFLTDIKLQAGDLVWGSMPLVVIPELADMKVKILASERDYKYISVNDSVSYTFDAMPGNTGRGKITKKAPVGQQQKEGSKVKFFEIEASIDSSFMLPEPGFTANCSILLKEIKDTIVVPQIAIFEEDSMKVVFVRKKNKFEMRQILTGITSPKEAIVSNGLHQNEIISLVKPPASSIKGKELLPDSVTKRSK